MGLFSSLVSNQEPTKSQICGSVSALIECVIQEEGVEILIEGFFALKSNFDVSFIGGQSTGGINFIAKVSPAIHLQEFLSLYDIQSTKSFNSVTVDRLTFAIISEFDEQSSAFRQLQRIFPPRGENVVVAMSRQYLDACKRNDTAEKTRLVRQDNQIQIFVETYQWYAAARARADQLSDYFVNGKTDAFVRMKL